MLGLSGVRKTMGDFTLAVDDFRVPGPGIYGLVGPNGCGKSTLAKLITGILTPDSGRVDTPLGGGEITMVTQKPYIMDDTVLNNLAYPLKVRGIKNWREPCGEYLEKIGFLGRGNLQARRLSGGEKQKLALLRAMIFGPRLAVLDESMTELDLDSLDLFTGMILERQKRDGSAWIVISHQLSLIRRMCSRVFFMTAGRLEAQGPTEEILRSGNQAVRRYLGNGGY